MPILMLNSSKRHPTLSERLERPTEQLLATGGDSRHVLDHATKMNKYGCSTWPQADVAPLGSCTASSVSTLGHATAIRLHNRLRALAHDADLIDAITEYFSYVRSELQFLLTGCTVPGLEIALTPSGTDAELIALALAHGDGTRRVTNILLGPTEVGSGTPLAAAGRYFDDLTPSGITVNVGDAVDQRMAERTELVSVALRDSGGVTREESDIDREVREIVSARISQGHNVLLHVIAHSKTGLHAPSLACIDELRKTYRERVLVVIDAAQGRFSRRGLQKVLHDGHLMIMTVSKFYGGPPFAGALLIPENATPQRRGIKRFANGFDRFFAFDYFPKTWRSLASGLPSPGSLGLLLRWTAGIAEMRQYYSTHTRLRLQVLRAFERTVPETFGRSPSIELEMPSAPILSDDFERVLQSKMTVFPFKVLDTKGKTVSAAGLRTIWRLLNLDASRLLPEAPVEQRRALAPRFHIGQPVALANGGEQPAVLRVALGGVLLMTVAQDPQWGLTYHDRVERLHDELLGLRRKIEAIVTHHAALQNRLESPHQAKIA